MYVHLLFPKLPPALDGIGDHTARLARALSVAGSEVRVLTAQADADPISGVTVTRAFSMEQRQGVREVLRVVKADPPDWLFLQFNQFSYGRWGLNPFVPLVVRRIKQQCPATRVAVLFHEDFVPVTNWKNAVMTTWQRAQFWSLGRVADLIFFSIAPWVKTYQSWFPNTTIRHLPVGSNIPRMGAGKEEARRFYDISPSTFVAGVFGSAHASRMLSSIRRAVEALNRRSKAFTVLYIGPHGDVLREKLGRLPLIDAGKLPAKEVSLGLAAMDVHLTPFIDGVSTRRGSFMAGLQHGVPSISTDGPLTDSMLRAADGEAFCLTPVNDADAFVAQAVEILERPQLRADLAAEGQALYDRSFSWETISRRLLEALQAIHPSPHNAVPPTSSFQTPSLS